MSKRKLDDYIEVSKILIEDVLCQNPPINLVPSFFAIPFAAPYGASIPSDAIAFSQDKEKSNISDTGLQSILNSDVWKEEDPDLAYVKFEKSSASHENMDIDQSAITSDINPLLKRLNPLSETDYFKRTLKAPTFAFIPNEMDDDKLLDMIMDDQTIDLALPVQNSFDHHSAPATGFRSKVRDTPDFKYELSVNRDSLLSILGEEFVQLVTRLDGSMFEAIDENHVDFDLWVECADLLPVGSSNIPRADILKTLRSRLIELLSSDKRSQIEGTFLDRLYEISLTNINDSLSMGWGDVTESSKHNEYLEIMESVFVACSIVITLLSYNVPLKTCKPVQDISLVIDFICLISTFLREHGEDDKNGTNLDVEFWNPLIKSLSDLILTLHQNIVGLRLDDSSITRLEYVSFEIIFYEIVLSKERSNIVVFLDSLKSCFAHIIISVYFKYEEQRMFIINEIVENIHLLNPLKSKSKNYRLKCGTSVQLVSYLIISLLHCHNEFGEAFDFAQWEYLSANHSTKSQKSQLEIINTSFWKSINKELSSFNQLVEYFVTSFFKKIISTYTPILRKITENLLTDFLTMLGRPEHPAASYLVSCILTVALDISSTTEESVTGAYALLFEIIGTVGSKILSLKQSRSHISFLSIDMPPSLFVEVADKQLLLLSYLKFAGNNTAQRESLFKFYSLMFLSDLKKMEEALSKVLSSNQDIVIGEKLSKTKRLAKTVNNYIYKQIELPFLNKSQFDVSSFLEPQIIELYNDLLASGKFFNRYNDILDFMLSSLNNPRARSRALAIKNLTLLIAREPQLLNDKKLRFIIKVRIGESYATVVDAALELVSKILESKPECIPEYYEVISMKILDPSVSVKRKVIGLIKHMFATTIDIDIKVTLIKALLSQMDGEDDRIIKLVSLTLCDLLFLSIGGNFLPHSNPDPVTLQKNVESNIAVLSGVYSSVGGILSDSQWSVFERFFEEKVLYRNEFNKKIRRELDLSIELLIEYMLEMVTDTLTEDKEQEHNTTADTESIMGILASFVQCDEKLLSQDQLITIQPYIINDKSNSNICYYALKILSQSLNYQKNLNKVFVQSCKTSLMNRLTKFNSKELDYAIQSLWKLFSIDGDTSSVSMACVSILKLLLGDISRMNDKENFKYNPGSSVQRLLYLIGYFGRYCNFERDRSIFMDANVGLQKKEAFPVFLLKYLLKFCDKATNSETLRKIAIRNALGICITYPKLFFSLPISQIISSSFEKNDLNIISVVVESLVTFLENEEIKMIKKNGLEIKRSGSIKLDVAIFHGYSLEFINDGICSTLVQKYMNNILVTCLEENNDIAMNSVRFLRLIIKFGFSNPKISFPTVVALECSKSKYIRHVALDLHAFLFQKYETLIESTYSEAFKNTIRYVSKIYSISDFGRCRKFLNSFFRIIKQRGSKLRIEKFMQAILRILTNVSFHKISRMERMELLNIQNRVLFFTININEIEFETQYEILTIINSIERVILNEENAFYDQSSELFDIFGDDNDDDCDLNGLRYLVLGRIILSLKSVLKTLTINYNISSELLLKFQESEDKKEFKSSVNKIQNIMFFNEDFKEVFLTNTPNKMAMLNRKMEQLEKM